MTPLIKISLTFTFMVSVLAGLPDSPSRSPNTIDCSWLHTQGPKYQNSIEDIYYCAGSCPVEVAHYDCDWIKLNLADKTVQIKIKGKKGIRTVSLDLFYFYEYNEKDGNGSEHIPEEMTSLLEIGQSGK